MSNRSLVLNRRALMAIAAVTAALTLIFKPATAGGFE